jgi:microcompartment protein CcmK/EutM
MVIYGETPSLIVTGEGGLGKTHSVSQAIDVIGLGINEYVFFKGYSTARGLYNTLYDNNGKLIIFDDCDSVLEDKVAVNILKSALDSYETRKISWMAKMNKNDEYPQQFDFTGRIIFISNKSKTSIDGAILSRSLTVDLTMTPDEKIERMTTILPNILPEYSDEVKVEALNFLNENKEGSNINMRTLIMVIKMASSNPDNWKSMASYMLNS